MNNAHDLAASLAAYEADRLNLGNEIDIFPAQVRAVAQACPDVEAG